MTALKSNLTMSTNANTNFHSALDTINPTKQRSTATQPGHVKDFSPVQSAKNPYKRPQSGVKKTQAPAQPLFRDDEQRVRVLSATMYKSAGAKAKSTK